MFKGHNLNSVFMGLIELYWLTLYQYIFFSKNTDIDYKCIIWFSCFDLLISYSVIMNSLMLICV